MFLCHVLAESITVIVRHLIRVTEWLKSGEESVLWCMLYGLKTVDCFEEPVVKMVLPLPPDLGCNPKVFHLRQ